uniref:FAD:protein FMN transferase n=1 Tax=uncultured bacterium 1042 TaxID=548897 RepID=B8R8U5_9BACT|nr:putative NosX protein [uncultured bacterium 1042]
MAQPLNRRRFVAISAAAVGLNLLPFGRTMSAEAEAVTWHGRALGAPASLTIHHHDRAAAERLVELVVVEVARLEAIFSLYRSDSAVAELNRIGALATPPGDLIGLLEAAHAFWESSEGAFDPTVQPVWSLLANHFSTADPDPAGPPEAQLSDALGLVGFGGVRFNRDRIAFRRPGMALSLNGIAQGYITDRVVELLRAGGIGKSLVDMGEIRGFGTQFDNQPWRVGVDGAPGEAGPLTILEIEDRAVATSRADGFRFDEAGRFNHLLDPRSGSGAHLYRSVVVIAPDATSADALSTAFSLLEPPAVQRIVAARPGLRVRLLPSDGDLKLIEFQS